MSRFVQCDTALTSDEIVASDPDTTAVVITDVGIYYLDVPMPCYVLWVVYKSLWGRPFASSCGQVICTDATMV